MNMKWARSLIGITLLALTAQAHAYLDPGTGSALIQGLIAGIAMAAVTLRLYWYKLLQLFSRKKEKSVIHPEAESDDQ